MKCPNCGAEVARGKYCSFCGSELQEQTSYLQLLFGNYHDNNDEADIAYGIEQLRIAIEDTCNLARASSYFVKTNLDPDEFIRADICYFVYYLLMDEEQFDEEILEFIEAGAGYKLDRKDWEACLKHGRVDSEENYLSQPPQTFTYLLQADNSIYEYGSQSAFAAQILNLVYRYIGDALAHTGSSIDVKRLGRLNRFDRMIVKYILANAKNPKYKLRVEDGEEWPMPSVDDIKR